MERPTIEVKLPILGWKVHLYTYYLRGETTAIEAIMLQGAEFERVEGETKLKRVDASYRSKMENEAVRLAVKEITDEDGKKIDKNQKFIENLPDDDFVLLQESLPKAQTKKKLTTKP